MPSVSVVIPTFNAARFVERAWRSLLRQTTGDWEAIFVDDNSADDTAAIIGGLCAAHARARLIRLVVNAGPAVARNRGIEAAGGEWIAVLDADDAFDPARLARLTEAGTSMGGDIVLDNLLILDPATMRPVRTAFEEVGPPRPLAPSEYLRGVQTGRSTFDWGFLKPVLRRAFLREHRVGYRPEMRFGEDVMLMLDAILAGARLVLAPEPLYQYTAQWSGAARAYSPTTRTINNYPALIAASRSVRQAATGGAAAGLGPLLASREESLRELSLVTDFRAALKARNPVALASCMTRPVRLARGVQAWRRRHRKLREMETRFAARATSGELMSEARRMSAQSNQRIDGRRLWDSLMDMATIGATPKGGVRRLTLTDVDRAGRERFRKLCEAAGLAVRVDAIGNMFARREGRDPSRLPVLVGSHLDSQPSGGKFDGALGVLGGLEVMRSLNDLGISTEAPIELVNWTDEEGSRFGHSLLGSGVWAGVMPLEKAYGLTDLDGLRVETALDGIGYRGPEPAEVFPADAYFELHIEQGPILERHSEQIGIVTGAQAMVWYDVVATGQDAHAGTTPPSARKDALVCAARVIDLVDRMMRARGEDGRGTVGQLVVLPNSRNVIPGEVRFSVEFRHPLDAEVDRLDAQFPREAGFIARDCGVKLEVLPVFKNPAQPFDPACVDLVRQAAARLGYTAREIVSGAGHDAVYVGRKLPAAMIFTPCKDGLSHNEAESIEPAEAEAGCQVLFEAVLARASRAI